MMVILHPLSVKKISWIAFRVTGKHYFPATVLKELYYRAAFSG
jgi:hypothetical protein